MRKRILKYLTAVSVVTMVNLLAGTAVQAASEKMVAGKRVIFQDNKMESLQDVINRREEDDQEYKRVMLSDSKKAKEYRKQMLSNGRESIKLLKEIRSLLRQLNRKD